MGYTADERVQVKLEFLRMLIRLELNPAKMHLITGFFETYLQLAEEEEARLQGEVKKLAPEEGVKLMEIMTSWEKKGMEKGIEQGIEKGIEKGRKKEREEVAKRLLRMGMSEENIAEATGLSEEEIKRLK